MSVGQSAETAAAVTHAPRVLYSSGQIVLTAFLLGPLPPLHMFISNFRNMGERRLLRVAVIWGYALLMSEILLVYFVPEHGIVATFLPPVNFGAAASLAYMYQPDASAISRSAGTVRAPLWRVAWVCLARSLEFLFWAVAVFGLLDYAGFSHVK